MDTDFTFTNCRMPCRPSSRPKPLFFTPPNGRRGSLATIELMNTDPASRSAMKRPRSAGSFVQALLPSPKDVLFASSTAPSRLSTRKISATGPKVSCVQTSMSGVSPSRAVTG